MTFMKLDLKPHVWLRFTVSNIITYSAINSNLQNGNKGDNSYLNKNGLIALLLVLSCICPRGVQQSTRHRGIKYVFVGASAQLGRITPASTSTWL